MHKLAYLLPPIALLAHYLWVNYYGGSPTVEWSEYLIVLAVCEGLVGLLHYLARRMGMDTEFLSGYVNVVRHYRSWTERVVTYETVRDSRGNSRTVQRVHYVQHPEYWDWQLNTGHTETIGYGVYESLVRLWGGCTTYFSTNHVNCVAGGGGDMCYWDNEVCHIQTQTYPQAYDNPLDQSNSIFRYEEISDKQAQEMGLYQYPQIHNYEQQPIVGLDLATDDDQRAFQLLNAMEGSACQVHFFVLLYDAAKGAAIGEQQRAYWHGGNKNEFTICLGVQMGEDKENIENTENKENTDNTDNTPILKWCNAFSWMDEPTMEVALEGWARDHTDQPLNLQDFCQWLYDNIKLWQRKEWKDFKYIANPMRGWQLALVFGGTLLVCAGAWYVLMDV